MVGRRRGLRRMNLFVVFLGELYVVHCFFVVHSIVHIIYYIYDVFSLWPHSYLSSPALTGI